MADEVLYPHHQSKSNEPSDAVAAAAPKAEEHAAVDASDRGLFDFLGKKEEGKCEGEVIAFEFEDKVKVSDETKKVPKEEEEKKKTLLEKFHRSSSSSSSSSDEEEVEVGGENKKKKKDKKAEEKYDDKSAQEPQEKKGFLEKFKEKLPGVKKAEEVASPTPTPAAAADRATTPEAEGKEKKGFLDKIKEKIPGYHTKSDDEKEGAISH